jgi:hypothetical protein
MAFNTTFLNRLERILLFRWDSAMAIDTFDHIQLVAWPLLSANASLPMEQSFCRDMAVFTFDLLDLFPVMAILAILVKGLAVIVMG